MERKTLTHTDDALFATLKNAPKDGKDRYTLYLSSALVAQLYKDATAKRGRVAFLSWGDYGGIGLALEEKGLKLRQLLSLDKPTGDAIAAQYGSDGDVTQGIRIEVVRETMRDYRFKGAVSG